VNDECGFMNDDCGILYRNKQKEIGKRLTRQPTINQKQ
jgi:hypothetical protein